MKTVTILEFRKNTEGILRKVGQGQSFILTMRGRPAARIEPIMDPEVSPDDPIYRLPDRAIEGGEALSNEEIDRAIYRS